MKNQSQGSLLEVISQIIEDATFKRLGRLSAAQALYIILVKKRGWCVGNVGWTWLHFKYEDGYYELMHDVGINSKYNLAMLEIENSGPHELLDLDDKNRIYYDDATIMLKLGVFPNQGILVRGEAWASQGYEGDWDGGYDITHQYIESAEMNISDFCNDLIEF